MLPRPNTGGTSAVRRLECERLEDRLTPAVTFQFDYRFDTADFFADPARRAALEQAGDDLTSRLTSDLSAIAPGRGDTWTARFFDPGTGNESELTDLFVPADTLVVFVGGQTISGTEAGFGGPGGYRVGGSADWQTTVATRGVGGFSTWGGSLTFDADTDWYFGASPDGLGNNKIDFYSVAVHELGHVLGFGTSTEYAGYLTGDTFVGPTATAVYGSAPPIDPDTVHWQQGIRSNGAPVSMQPVLEANQRVGYSDLDYAALRDIGWNVSGLPVVAVPNIIEPAPLAVGGEPATVSPGLAIEELTGSVPAGSPGGIVVASGPTDGTVQVFSGGAGGNLTPAGSPLRPFGNFDGAVRSVSADVNGDGVPDIVLGTGPFGGSRIRVLDGRTFADLIPAFSAFEASFTGGVFLAAGDFNGDGRAEIVVTPDEGGGGRVRVLDLATGSPRVMADFFGIDDDNFRGGARAAVGDINGDGIADLVVSAGFGGGPRVAVFDGRSVAAGQPGKLVNDFFAFESTLRNGVYVTVGDFNGDGFGDLVFGAGPGGGPRVLVVSGADVLVDPSGAVAGPMADFFAGPADQRGGVRVAAKDVDADGATDVVTGSGAGSTPRELRVYLGDGRGGVRQGTAVDPFGGVDADGIYVG